MPDNTAVFVFLTFVLLLETVLVESRRRPGPGCEDDLDWRIECPYIKKNYGNRICRSNNRHFQRIASHCLKTCDMCPERSGRPRAPQIRCAFTQFGCCWDGETIARGMRDEGCPRCVDDYPKTCRRFRFLCTYKSHYAEFIHISCPVSCGQCRPPPSLGGKKATRHETLSDIIARVAWRKHSRLMRKIRL